MLEVLGYTNNGEVSQVQMKKGVSAQTHGSLLASADFHGAEVEVARSKDTSKVGIKGIVVRDTKFTFVLVTQKNEMKVIPKEKTVFKYWIKLPEGERSVVLELHGSQFQKRPAERANRQFKWQVNMDYL